MVGFGRAGSALQRDRNTHPRSFATLDAADPEDAAKQGGSFTHAQKAHRLCIKKVRPRDPAAIILYLQSNSAVGFFQIDRDLRGSGMTNDVG
jgi:hypothetical protein